MESIDSNAILNLISHHIPLWRIEFCQNKQHYYARYINRPIAHNIRIINNWKETETEIIKTETIKPDDLPTVAALWFIAQTIQI